MNNYTDLSWYPIRVTYGREMKLKSYLDTLGIYSFIPMHYVEIVKNGKKTKNLTSVIKNLIFIQSTRKSLDLLKPELELRTPIRYMMDKATHKPIIIPDEQMQNFMAVSGTNDEQLVYLSTIEPTLKRGERVRVTGGLFSGVEGEVVRVKRDRRVMVCINGVIAVATTYISSLLLERI